MYFFNYYTGDGVRVAVGESAATFDLSAAGREIGLELPSEMRAFIQVGDEALNAAEETVRSTRSAPLGPVRIAPPVWPLRTNVFAVGRNYRDHISEGARARGEVREEPQDVVFFSKAASAVVGHDADIECDPTLTKELDYEVELVVVIGEGGRDIPVADASRHIFGYTIGNDVTARDVQRAHLQWFKGKSMDTFCPLGPRILPSRYFGDPHDKRIALRVNGEIRQEANTSEMIFSVPTIVHRLSQGLTLEPGDLIMTGTPAGAALGMRPQRWLRPGDLVEAEIEGIGVLRNRVVRAGSMAPARSERSDAVACS